MDWVHKPLASSSLIFGLRSHGFYNPTMGLFRQSWWPMMSNYNMSFLANYLTTCFWHVLPSASAVCALCDHQPWFLFTSIPQWLSVPWTSGDHLFTDNDRFVHLATVLLKSVPSPTGFLAHNSSSGCWKGSAWSLLRPIPDSPIIPVFWCPTTQTFH